ncbi:MAG: type IV toxin-antitoxin system AbiEi family antitoxin domain-containing protein [Gammaproteobacteria bacterium]|nr:type IV toxin-antitoxin system AbiEi family antitoxin domain-containing protein [Gammaproteobacteria bacterium]
MSSMADYQTLQGADLGAFFRARDAVALGIHPRRLGGLVSEGYIEKYGRGLYRFRDSEAKALELESYVMLSTAVPNAIICLASALSIHEIGTQSPSQVWFAIDRKARMPRNLPIQSRIVRFSGAMLTYGVEDRMAQGVSFRITSPARTIVDCFRYRRTCGLDIALEALYDVIRGRDISVDEIERAAEVCRVRTVIAPYIDAFGWIDSLG